jgi:hypothetical protein
MRAAVIMVNDFPKHVVQLWPDGRSEQEHLVELQSKFAQKRIEEFKQRRPNDDPKIYPFDVGYVHVHAFDLE